MKHLSIKLLSALGLMMAYSAGWAGPALTGIEVARLSGDEEVLRLNFDGPVTRPNSFAIANPPRIALDFPGASVRLPSPAVDLGNNLVRSATAVEAGGRARVVLNLLRNASYSTTPSGNTVTISLNGNAQAAREATPAESVPAPRTAVTDPAGAVDLGPVSLDFKRGRNGEGRLELVLPSSTVSANVRREGRAIVVDLPGVTLSRAQQRKLDVTDFGTPVRSIDASNQGRGSRLVIEPQGDWDFSSYQTDNRLTVEVRRPVVDTANPQGADVKPVYKGDKLSLNFQNIEVRTVLQVIAEFTGLNIVTSDSVTGNITLRLKDVPWDQALDLILQTKGLDQRRSGNIIHVAPRQELLDRDKQVLEARQQLTALEPIRSETFLLRYKSVEEFKNVLDTPVGDNGGRRQTLLSDRGSALIDSKTNTLIINDTPTVIEKIRTLVDKLDVPIKQVLIEARIVEASDNFSRDLGVKLNFARLGRNVYGGNLENVIKNSNTRNTNSLNEANRAIAATNAYNSWLANPTGAPPAIPPLTASLPYELAPGVNLPISNAAGSIAALFKAGASSLIGLELQAMQAEDKGKVVASPRVMTSDRTEASIEEGAEIPYQEASSSGATSVSFKKAVMSLRVKPQITPDDNILMDIQVNKDTPNFKQLVGGTPALDTKKINTQVLVENGGTVVIGGIYVQEQSNVVNKVPLLGDIPYLGALFRSKQERNDRRELLVFITPRIVDNLRITTP